MESVVSELEGILLKDKDTFSYFMLLAFEASGLIRFALLLLFWPIIRLFDICGKGNVRLKLTVFIATAGLRLSDIESVARAVLPKFYFDDIDMEVWSEFSLCDRRVVVTKMPRVLVERFVKEHLRADEVIGSELVVNRFGFVTGFIKSDVGSISDRIMEIFGDEKPSLGLGRHDSDFSVLSLCKVSCIIPYEICLLASKFI